MRQQRSGPFGGRQYIRQFLTSDARFRLRKAAASNGGIIAAGLLVSLGWYAANYQVSGVEYGVFRLANGLPAFWAPLFIAVMQLGAYLAVPAAAAVALVCRRQWLAIELFVAGNLAYWLAELCKQLVGRERPSLLLDGVAVRDAVSGTLGFPSGHAAVAAALGLVAMRYVPGKLHGYIWLLVALVAVARMYAGVHLPLDVIGGFLAGWLAAVLVGRVSEHVRSRQGRPAI